jgi:hypothetical protein
MSTIRYEDTVEGRIIAYFDFIFITAKNFLRPYVDAYGFDLQMEAQDITQYVAEKTLASDAFGEMLGANFFKVSTENACKNFLESLVYEAKKGQNWGGSTSWTTSIDRSGWLDFTASVRKLPNSQRMAVFERYLGYEMGDLSGSETGSRSGFMRARKTLTAA